MTTQYKCNGCRKIWPTKSRAEECCAPHACYDGITIVETTRDIYSSPTSNYLTFDTYPISSSDYSGGGGSFDGGGCSSDY